MTYYKLIVALFLITNVIVAQKKSVFSVNCFFSNSKLIPSLSYQKILKSKNRVCFRVGIPSFNFQYPTILFVPQTHGGYTVLNSFDLPYDLNLNFGEHILTSKSKYSGITFNIEYRSNIKINNTNKKPIFFIGSGLGYSFLKDKYITTLSQFNKTNQRDVLGNYTYSSINALLSFGMQKEFKNIFFEISFNPNFYYPFKNNTRGFYGAKTPFIGVEYEGMASVGFFIH